MDERMESDLADLGRSLRMVQLEDGMHAVLDTVPRAVEVMRRLVPALAVYAPDDMRAAARAGMALLDQLDLMLDLMAGIEEERKPQGAVVG